MRKIQILIFIMGLVVSLSAQVTVDQNQNVGVGTDTPAKKFEVETADGDAIASFKDSDSNELGLVISGDPAGAWLGNDNIFQGQGGYFKNSDNTFRWYTGGSEFMRWDSDGNVGIGITSPAVKLHVDGNLTLRNNLFFLANNDNFTQIQAKGGQFILRNLSPGATSTIRGTRSDGSQLHQMTFAQTYNLSTNIMGVSAPSQGGTPISTLTVRNDQSAGENAFTVLNGADYLMHLLNNGNLGLGSGYGVEKLHVYNPIDTYIRVASNDNESSGLEFTERSNAKFSSGSFIGARFRYDGASEFFFLETKRGVNQKEAFRVDAGNGNIGVGFSTNTAPSAALDVNGSVKIKDVLNMAAKSTAPSNPATGDIYLDDGTNTGGEGPKLRYYDGMTWIKL